LRQQIRPGDGVVLLDKERRQRAEGTLTGLQPNGWAGNGIQAALFPLAPPFSTVRFEQTMVPEPWLMRYRSTHALKTQIPCGGPLSKNK
jgi:hypothetical protein